jgi:hypothetical protein
MVRACSVAAAGKRRTQIPVCPRLGDGAGPRHQGKAGEPGRRGHAWACVSHAQRIQLGN